MSMPFLSTTMLRALFGRDLPGEMIEESGPDWAFAYKIEYARRAGYRLGADGAWIAELPPQDPATR